MRRITAVFLAAAIALGAGAGARAAGQTLWVKTSSQILRQGTWRNEIRVVLVPLTARAVLAKCYDPQQDSAQLGKTWVAELKRLSVDKQNVFAIYVSRIDSQVPSRQPLSDLMKSPLFLVGADRLIGRVVEPFGHDTLENVQSDQAIVAFERRESFLREHVNADVDQFVLRLLDPDKIFEFSEWVEGEFKLPLPYPAELQDLYIKLSPSVPKQYLTSF